MALKMDFNENDEVSKTPPKLVDKIGQLYLTDLSNFKKPYCAVIIDFIH